MSLCINCISGLIDKLTPNDIYVLHELKDKTTAQTGETKKELFNELKDVMTVFQLQQALMRLGLLGFIGSQRYGRTIHYHITPSGLAVLDILSSR